MNASNQRAPQGSAAALQRRRELGGGNPAAGALPAIQDQTQPLLLRPSHHGTECPTGCERVSFGGVFVDARTYGLNRAMPWSRRIQRST